MPNALITGGSRGFGRALARALGENGWTVTINGRTAATVAEATAPPGRSLHGVVGTIRDHDHRMELVRRAGDLDLLVNNASHLGPSPLRHLASVEPAQLHEVFDTNLVSPLALIGLAMPGLRARSGIVVNISSDAAVEAYRGWGAYGASKAGLDHAGRVLAEEFPEVAVYSFDPGDMRTDMHQAAFPGEDISDRPPPESVVPALVRLIESRPDSGRYTAAQMMSDVG